LKPIIKIENLSKQYHLGTIGTGTLSHDLKRWWTVNIRGKADPYLKIGETNVRATKGTSEYVWALKDINLEVMPGEVLGIIGKNGAGKSTLLKILSKVTGPTTGNIHYDGRIGSLLEVGTGFHSELTGRENIFLNGAILGMTKAEIRKKLDEIIDFSGCERYIDTPVKRYSSGMLVRLGFAVAAHLEPEILVVDEVLAVGDAEFQKKAIGKMQDVSKQDGRTVLFVSHNMNSIQLLCPISILMKDGQLEMYDKTNKVIDYYTFQQETKKDFSRKGSKKVVFIDYSILNNVIELSDDINIVTKIKCESEVSKIDLSFDIVNEKYEQVAHVSNYDDSFIIKELNIGEAVEIICTIRNVNLAPGKYFATIWIGDKYECFDCIINCLTFYIEQGNKLILRPHSFDAQSKVVLPSQWKVL
jgi:lipopolysaccharide transport system ATP-binding protein